MCLPFFSYPPHQWKHSRSLCLHLWRNKKFQVPFQRTGILLVLIMRQLCRSSVARRGGIKHFATFVSQLGFPAATTWLPPRLQPAELGFRRPRAPSPRRPTDRLPSRWVSKHACPPPYHTLRFLPCWLGFVYAVQFQLVHGGSVCFGIGFCPSTRRGSASWLWSGSVLFSN
jgi:hypothetical protein